MVFDPKTVRNGKDQNGWNAFYVTNDFNEIIDMFWKYEGCLFVFDEVGELSGEQLNEFRKMLTRASGQSHTCILISQRHKRIDKTAREQCSVVIAFKISLSDAKEMAEEWDCPQLAEAANLPKFHYIRYEHFGEVKKGKVTFS